MASKKTKPTPTKKSAPRKIQAARALKQTKPLFRAGTWIALLLLAVLIGVTYYLNNKEQTADVDSIPAANPATFVFDEGKTISGIEIKPADGETVKVARNAENAWALKLPQEAEADQGLVEAAASQITALIVIDNVDADPSIFGFDAPAYIITIQFADGTKSTLEVGDPTPTNSGYYVRVDKKKMVIVGLSGIDALTSLTLFPPYLNTPTPTALPATPTPDSPTQAVSTPEAAITPSP